MELLTNSLKLLDTNLWPSLNADQKDAHISDEASVIYNRAKQVNNRSMAFSRPENWLHSAALIGLPENWEASNGRLHVLGRRLSLPMRTFEQSAERQKRRLYSAIPFKILRGGLVYFPATPK